MTTTSADAAADGADAVRLIPGTRPRPGSRSEPPTRSNPAPAPATRRNSRLGSTLPSAPTDAGSGWGFVESSVMILIRGRQIIVLAQRPREQLHLGAGPLPGRNSGKAP